MDQTAHFVQSDPSSLLTQKSLQISQDPSIADTNKEISDQTTQNDPVDPRLWGPHILSGDIFLVSAQLY